jgi:hypothetical protein
MTHTEPWQFAPVPPGQTWPQAPQLLGSLVGSTHVPPQHGTPPAEHGVPGEYAVPHTVFVQVAIMQVALGQSAAVWQQDGGVQATHWQKPLPQQEQISSAAHTRLEPQGVGAASTPASASGGAASASSPASPPPVPWPDDVEELFAPPVLLPLVPPPTETPQAARRMETKRMGRAWVLDMPGRQAGGIPPRRC